MIFNFKFLVKQFYKRHIFSFFKINCPLIPFIQKNPLLFFCPHLFWQKKWIDWWNKCPSHLLGQEEAVCSIAAMISFIMYVCLMHCTTPGTSRPREPHYCSRWLATDLLIAKVSEPLNILQNQIWQWKGVCMFNTCTVITYSGVTVFKTVGILVEMVARGESF